MQHVTYKSITEGKILDNWTNEVNSYININDLDIVEDDNGISFNQSIDTIWKNNCENVRWSEVLRPRIHIRPKEYELVTKYLNYYTCDDEVKINWVKLIAEQVIDNHYVLVEDHDGIFYEQSADLIWNSIELLE